MEYWQTLVGQALVGTERQSPEPPKEIDALTHVLGQLDWPQPERAILSAAAAIAQYRQVGQRPMASDWPGVEPCPLDETLAPCDPQTVRHLNQVMDDYPAMMPELLQLIAAAAQRVPPQLLPKLFQFGHPRSKIQEQITQVIGARGHWLAAQNPDWTYGQGHTVADFDAKAPNTQALWQGGSRRERTRLLQQWRHGDPHGARDALESRWTSELAKDREGLITALAPQISMADEPFLEKALKDRAQAVRAQAATLLAQLPTSRLCQRMAERADQFIAIQSTPGSPDITITITLPTTFDSAWAKDGIKAGKMLKFGKRASWVYQIISQVPLDHWPAAPQAMVTAMQGHEWQDLLLRAWSLAAHNQQNIAWASVLLPQIGWQQHYEALGSNLFTLFSLEEQEQRLGAVRLPQEKEELLYWLRQVTRCPGTWSLDFSRLVLKQMVTLIKSGDRRGYELSHLMKTLPVVLHVKVTPEVTEALQQLPTDDSFAWVPQVWGEFQRRMEFRHTLHQVFHASG